MDIFMKKIFAILLAAIMMLSMTAMAASITITPPALNDGTETGITYKAYKIFDATIVYKTDAEGKVTSEIDKIAYTISKDNPYFNTINAATTYFTLTQSAGDANVYTVTVKAAYTADAANDFADTLKAVAATAVGTQSGNQITGLTNGYYLVTSSVGTDLILDTIGDITVATKNEYPQIAKWVETENQSCTTADHDEVLKYIIKVTIPEDATGEIVVHDDMTNLEYQSMTAVDGITVTQNPTTKDAEGNDVAEGCEVHFTLSASYVAANRGKQPITIEYTAKFTGDDDAANVAWLTDDTYTSKTVETCAHTTDVIVDKHVSGSETSKLAGAKFVLKNEAGKFYKVSVDDETTEANEAGTVTWVATQAEATVVTTNDKGVAEFENVADGKYYLVETEAPTGYNLLTSSVEVNVDHNEVATTHTTDVTTKVANSSGTELPSTGGMGTTIFYVVGGMMMAAALVLLVSKRKVAASK